MLTGSADPALLAELAPEMESLDPEPAVLADVEVLQAVFEMPFDRRQPTLPPALHPTSPPLLVVLAWRVPDSEWGPFQLVQARVSCRSGVRPRGYLSGCVVDNPAATHHLRSRWGLPAVAGEVSLQRHYEGTELSAGVDGRTALRLVAHDPDPLGTDDVQYTVTMTLARTPRGPRLVQLEPEYSFRRVERLRPRLESFDPTGWADPLLAPRHPVSASVAVGDVALPRLRYVCRPDVLAFDGTERL